MGIAEDYCWRSGETLSQAVTRMHAEGYGITAAAAEIGYTPGDLRHALRKRHIACPWPPGSRVQMTGRAQTITEQMVTRYVAMRRAGKKVREACGVVGCSPGGINHAIRTRHPEFAHHIEEAGPLDDRALAALDVMSGMMSAMDLALRVGRTTQQARNYLARLEAQGLVERLVLSERKVFWRRAA